MKKINTFLVVLVLISVALTGCNKHTETSAVSGVRHEEVKFPWIESSPDAQGMNVKRTEQIEAQIASNYTNIDSILIIKNGYLVYEKYFNHKNSETTADVFSITKSVLSALTGIAIEQGYLTGTDQKLSSLLNEFSEQPDTRKMGITVHDILTMTGGLDSVDDDFNNWIQSPNLLLFAINKPMVSDPGTVFKYNTGLTHMLSALLTKATGMSTKEFADKNLFGPLGIVDYQWQQDSNGIYFGGTNLSMLPKDMAKIGYLYLQHGKWEGKQIVPESWVAESTDKQVSVEPNVDYGYLFWLKTMTDEQGKRLETYEANGYMGQHIRVIPQLNSVIVITSNHLSFELSRAEEIMERYILPALRK